jgi:hypothetical protein
VRPPGRSIPYPNYDPANPAANITGMTHTKVLNREKGWAWAWACVLIQLVTPPPSHSHSDNQ